MWGYCLRYLPGKVKKYLNIYHCLRWSGFISAFMISSLGKFGWVASILVLWWRKDAGRRWRLEKESFTLSWMGRACLLRAANIRTIVHAFPLHASDTLSQEHVIWKPSWKQDAWNASWGVSSLQCACSVQVLHSFETFRSFLFKCVGLCRGIKSDWRKSNCQM